ncbi:alpha/beta-hydrolase [Annulohypoxylon maeteangense]|uniref:alpha/beta-hydrolase n=1 Tax=Annulohypoxylon maeteangense TaxID=1927788 RepID=UPI002007CD8F|nr:alpha/beta-hydrolase [Annulohypoxylon maeteangense]KAI0882243.1 alpha/beta-hydrolase [Annulohypoxylon maeteangense]
MLFIRGLSRMSIRRLSKLASIPSQPSTTPRISNNNTLTCKRKYHVEGLQGLMLAPAVFGGLFVALWTWKCFMLVIFQNKIIFMPGLPPNSRWEKIQDYIGRCAGVQWREERVRARDGTDLALCVADLDLGSSATSVQPSVAFYILYFQGNASSIPPRLPDLSSALCMLKRRSMQWHDGNIRCTMVCLSYRGYWTSRGRPTEKGINMDSAAALHWISQMHRNTYGGEDRESRPSAKLVLWGQSIGAGVATNLAAQTPMPANVQLDSLVLETPFTSIRAMLEVLYPQRWLPYRHLWPFLRSHLDSWKNLGIISENYGSRNPPEIFILEAAKDELVPHELSQKLYDRCLDTQLPVSRKAVGGAFHNDAMFRGEGRRAVSDFLSHRITSARV